MQRGNVFIPLSTVKTYTPRSAVPRSNPPTVAALAGKVVQRGMRVPPQHVRVKGGTSLGNQRRQLRGRCPPTRRQATQGMGVPPQHVRVKGRTSSGNQRRQLGGRCPPSRRQATPSGRLSESFQLYVADSIALHALPRFCCRIFKLLGMVPCQKWAVIYSVQDEQETNTVTAASSSASLS